MHPCQTENCGDFVKLLKTIKAKKVLDLGCGTGRHTIALAKNGFETYGIDISKNALKVCRERLKDKNLKADLKLGDIYKLSPYQDNFFDGVISTNALHHGRVYQIKKLIKEIQRILKPGAIIMVEVPRKVGKFYDKEIESGTVVPQEGSEQGIPHHIFRDKNEVREFFKNFEVIKIFKKQKKNLPKPSHHFLMLGRNLSE